MATRRVFLVDDDPMHNDMLKDHLGNKLNVEITTFSTGEDCLRNIQQAPEVVVLDYYLDSKNKSAKNGIEVLQEIKQMSPATEVIMLSGQDKIEVAVETMKNGAFDYVIKNESAFVRTENVMFNIFKSFKLQENLKIYKFGFFFLAAAVVLIIVAAVVLRMTGVASNSPGWM